MDLSLAQELAALRLGLPAGTGCLELDPGLAAALVEGALGKKPTASSAAFRALREEELGVLAYLGARFLRAAAPQGARVLGWTTDSSSLARVLGEEAQIAVEIEVESAGTTHFARLWLPASCWPARPPDPELKSFSGEQVSLRVEVGLTTLGATELDALGEGDVVLVEAATAQPEGALLRGQAWLRLPLARRARFCCALEGSGSLHVERICTDEEAMRMTMSDDATRRGELGAIAREVPVELRIEIGRLTLPLASVAGLAPGEVLVLDRAPGDPLALMSGERCLAHGQLVVVDGQVGLRITDVAL